MRDVVLPPLFTNRKGRRARTCHLPIPRLHLRSEVDCSGVAVTFGTAFLLSWQFCTNVKQMATMASNSPHPSFGSN
jgi:hypothetical protein